jgi:putative (di)nucleoside polyphosphate hydrolase
MSLPKQYFRVGAGAVIVNATGLVFAVERKAVAGAWQLPQGGLDHNEEPLQAVYRELFEETGIRAADLELLGCYPEPLAYELPAALRKPKTGRGQVQYWFLFYYRGDETTIDIQRGGEAKAWQWMPFGLLTKTVADFRKPIYAKLYEHFHEYFNKDAKARRTGIDKG